MRARAQLLGGPIQGLQTRLHGLDAPALQVKCLRTHIDHVTGIIPGLANKAIELRYLRFRVDSMVGVNSGDQLSGLLFVALAVLFATAVEGDGLLFI
jgi:hypothetical protein